MSNAQAPIGVFDSGLGGLTVLKEMIALLPAESTVYFGDTGRTPYGSKSSETIIKYALQIARFLRAQHIKMLVIACNTASARAYQAVCELMQIPVVEVITPGAQAAVQSTVNRKIGVIGTRATIESDVYVDAIRRFAGPDMSINQQACPLFVSLAEEGWWHHEVTRQIADVYLQPLKQAQVDTLVLGCTHYPLLKDIIAQSAGPAVTLVDAANRVSKRVHDELAAHGLMNQSDQTGNHVFYTSDSITYFQKLGSLFLGRPIHEVERIDIERF